MATLQKRVGKYKFIEGKKEKEKKGGREAGREGGRKEGRKPMTKKSSNPAVSLLYLFGLSVL